MQPPTSVHHPGERLGAARALLFASAVTPLVLLPTFYPPTVPRAVFFRSLVEIAGWFLVLVLLRHETRLRRDDWFFWGLVSLTGAYGISAVLGVSPLHSLFGDMERMWGLFSWVHLVVFYLLLRTFLVDEQGWVWLLRGVVAVGVLMAMLAVLESHSYLFGARHFGNVTEARLYRASGLAGNAGYLSSYLLLVVGAAALLWLRARGRLERGLYPLAGVLLLAGWTTTRTRSTLLGLVVAVVWALGLNAILSRHRRSRTVAIVALSLASLVGGLAVTRPALVSWIPGLDRIATEGMFDQPRLIVWSAAWRAAQKRPLTGYGLENVYQAHSGWIQPRLFDLPAMRDAQFDRVHNIILDTLLTAGVAGVLSLLLAWCGLAWSVFRGWRSGRLSRPEFLVVSSALLAYFLYLNFWFEDWVSFPVFLVLAAWVQHRVQGGPLLELTPLAVSARRTLPALFIAGLILLLAVHQHGVRVLHASRLATEALRSEAIDERLDRLREALAIEAPGSRPLGLLTAQQLVAHAHQVDPDTLNQYQRQVLDAALNSALSQLSEEIMWDPRNDLLHAVQSQVQYVGLMLHEHPLYYLSALQNIGRAIELSPNRIPYYHHLAELHLAAGQEDEAEAVLRAVLARYDRFAETYFLLATTMLANGDAEAAREWMLRGLEVRNVPSNPALVRMVAERQPPHVRGKASIALFRTYLKARYGGQGYTPSTSLRASPSSSGDWSLAAALPVLYLQAGDTASALRAARRVATVMPSTAPSVRAFLSDVAKGNGRKWIERGNIFDVVEAHREAGPAAVRSM